MPPGKMASEPEAGGGGAFTVEVKHGKEKVEVKNMMASRAPSRAAATAAALLVLTAALLIPAADCGPVPRVEGGEGRPSDSEAEAKLLLYQVESLYVQPSGVRRLCAMKFRWAGGGTTPHLYSPPAREPPSP